LTRPDPACAIAWLVLPWICHAASIGLVMWLSSLVGGAAALFSAVACGIVCWLFFKQAGKEKIVARLIGYGFSVVFGLCAVVIVAGGING